MCELLVDGRRGRSQRLLVEDNRLGLETGVGKVCGFGLCLADFELGLLEVLLLFSLLFCAGSHRCLLALLQPVSSRSMPPR